MSETSPLEDGQGRFDLRPRWRLSSPGPEAGEGPHPLVVALHGMGQNLDLMADQVHPLLEARRFVLIPEAPLPFERKAEDGSREIGNAWYVYTGDQADFLAWAERAEAYLLSLIEDLVVRHPVDPDRITLVGYSQGGYLAGILALRNPERFRATAIVNARVKHEVSGRPAAPARTPEFLVLHGERDRFIPVDAARDAAERLIAEGGNLTFETFPSGHRFVPEQAERIRDWLLARNL